MKSKLFFLVIFFILFVSCEEELSHIPHTTVDILIEYPSDLEELSVQYESSEIQESVFRNGNRVFQF